MHAGFGATADDNVASTRGHQSSRGCDRMGACGARGADHLGRAAPSETHGDAGRAGVGHHHRHEAWRHAARPLLVVDADLTGQGLQTAHAGREDDPRLGGVHVELAGIRDRHGG